MVAADLRAASIVGADPAQRDNGHSEIGRYLLLASGILTRRSSKFEDGCCGDTLLVVRESVRHYFD